MNTKKYRTSKKLGLMMLISTSFVQAQEDSIAELEETLTGMGSSIELELHPQAQNLREWEDEPWVEEDEALLEEYLFNTEEFYQAQESADYELPDAQQLMELTHQFHYEGMAGLEHSPVFENASGNHDSIGHQCNTYVPAVLFSLASALDHDQAVEVAEQMTQVLTEPVHQGYTMENLLGEDWQVEAEFEGNDHDMIELEESEPYFLEQWVEDTITVYQEQEAENEPYQQPPVLYHHLPNHVLIKKAKPRDRFNTAADFLNKACDRLAQSGTDPNAWMTYERHPEFTIHYRLCGNNGVSSDIYERVINKSYLMPNWEMVPLQRCSNFNRTCAPMHVQMIAADILYQRKTLQKAGFKLPGHWNVEIHSNDPRKGSSAFLGTIKLNGVAEGVRGLRNLVFHEYFHAIETMYGSEWEFLFNGELFGRFPSFHRNTSWWSQLESLADWVPYALSLGDNPWPNYYNPEFGGYNTIADARNHLFNSSYHPLEYGYLAERYSSAGNSKSSECLGCDSMKLYLEILNGEPYGARLWNHNDIALYTFEQMKKTGVRPTVGYERGSVISLNRFMQDYHLDLLFSRMDRKWATTSGNFRFFNRFAPKTNTLWPELTQWPPAMQKVPDSMDNLFGLCTQQGKPLTRANARAVGSRYIHGFSCDMKISPTGAIYLDIPLDNGNLPDEIMISGVGVKLHNDDINAYEPPVRGGNYRIKPGELINGNLRIFTVPAELTSPNTLDFNETKALNLYGNMATQNSYTISLKNHNPDTNRLYLVVDYPFLSPSWLRAPNGLSPQRENFMARVVVVGYWNN